MSWEEFIGFLLKPNGIAAAVGLLWSVAIEYVPGFEALAPKWKRVVFAGVCLVVPLLASALGMATGVYAPSFRDVVWPAIVAGCVAFGAGTLLHARKLPDAPATE